MHDISGCAACREHNVLKVSNDAEWVLSVLSDHCKVYMQAGALILSVVEEVEMEVMLCL